MKTVGQKMGFCPKRNVHIMCKDIVQSLRKRKKRLINCRHVIYPYIQGKSTKRYEPYDTTENDRVYKESQQQRSLERQIRKAKKEVKVMEALGDSEGVKEAKNKVSQRQTAMKEFINQTKRKRQYNREQIV